MNKENIKQMCFSAVLLYIIWSDIFVTSIGHQSDCKVCPAGSSYNRRQLTCEPEYDKAGMKDE